MAEEQGERAGRRAETAPDPEDARKADHPTELTKRSWTYVLGKTVREFASDQCTDLAAALTYFAVLAIFPALLALVSILGLFSNPQRTVDALLNLVSGLVSKSALGAVRGSLDQLATSGGAGLALVVGIAGAVWSASGYVGAFARAMNRIYSIQEGRPVWKLRPLMLGVTVLALLAAVVAIAVVVLSGPLARRIGAQLGLGAGVAFIWDIVKWPVVVALAVLVIAVLYHATPNLRQPRFRWVSIGSIIALIVWALASVAFAFYIANFASYNRTYGSIGGIIVFLLWVWITNNALLFGAELDAELERGRELQAGIAAEENVQLPPRDTRQSDKKAEKQAKDVVDGRRLRQSRGGRTGGRDR